MPGVAGHSGGRNAKTSQQHHLDGSLRKDRHGEAESPNPPKTRPEPPKELEGDALGEWHRMIWRLEVSGSLTTVDDAAVYQYCRLFGETEATALEQAEARASVKILEENLCDIKDMDVKDRIELFTNIVKLRTLISKCTDQLRNGRQAIRAYLVEFGMTPAARSRVKLPKGATKPENKWEGVLTS